MHQRTVNQHDERSGAESEGEYCEAPVLQFAAGEKMRGKKLPKEWLFQRKKHEKQGDINGCVCRNAIDSCPEKRRKQCKDQSAAQCMQQKIPKHLHANHENMMCDLVADDDERKREERKPSEKLDALEGFGIESCMIKIYGIYRQGDGSPKKKVFPKADAFFGAEL